MLMMGKNLMKIRIFIISLDYDELVLVEIEGDLKEKISVAIRERRIANNNYLWNLFPEH